MSVRDISRELTSLGTEIYLQGKLLGAVGEFFAYAQEQIPKIAEGAVGLIQDERALLSTAEGVQVYIADEALSVAKAEAQLHYMRKASNTGSSISRVNNIQEFFQTTFGQQIKKFAEKTSHRYHGQSIYKITGKIKHPELSKGCHFYLDGLHKDHIEVFDKFGNFKTVLNLDGSINIAKTSMSKDRIINL